MPLIRISVPEGTATEKKQIIHKRVREVVLKTLAPKQVRYDYVSIAEAFGVIGDGLPVIDVDLRPGREPERKKGLVDGIAEVLPGTATCGVLLRFQNTNDGDRGSLDNGNMGALRVSLHRPWSVLCKSIL